MDSRIKKLILTIQKNLNNNETEDAVKNDKILTAAKVNLWSQVTSQSALHKNQFDFIFKHKIIYRTKELFFITIGGYLTVLAVNTDNDFMQFLTAGLSTFMFFQLFLLFKKHSFPNRMMGQLYDRMMAEKAVHVDALDTIDQITLFQQQTNDIMYKLYEEEEDGFISDLGVRMRKELQQKYPELKDDDK